MPGKSLAVCGRYVVLSVSSIARESGVKRSTIDAYFDILEDMLVTARLPVFSRRAKSGLEVDFVEYGEQRFRAIEVKNSTHVERRDAAGLEAFHDDYPEAETLLLYRSVRKVRITDHVDAIPVEEFLFQG